MSGSKKPKSEQRKNEQKLRTARNQIKRYEKALDTAKGSARDAILKKIEFYKSRLID